MSEPTLIIETDVVRLSKRVAELEEQAADCCADAEIAGYMGENLDSAAQCFREKIAEQTARIAELETAARQLSPMTNLGTNVYNSLTTEQIKLLRSGKPCRWVLEEATGGGA